jgi:hypothetical protein
MIGVANVGADTRTPGIVWGSACGRLLFLWRRRWRGEETEGEDEDEDEDEDNAEEQWYLVGASVIVGLMEVLGEMEMEEVLVVTLMENSRVVFCVMRLTSLSLTLVMLVNWWAVGVIVASRLGLFGVDDDDWVVCGEVVGVVEEGVTSDFWWAGAGIEARPVVISDEGFGVELVAMVEEGVFSVVLWVSAGIELLPPVIEDEGASGELLEQDTNWSGSSNVFSQS